MRSWFESRYIHNDRGVRLLNKATLNMDYSIQEARHQFEAVVEAALNERDADRLYALATHLEEDEAQPLLSTLARWKAEDDAALDYDRAVDNGLI